MKASFEVAQVMSQHWAEVQQHPQIKRW